MTARLASSPGLTRPLTRPAASCSPSSISKGNAETCLPPDPSRPSLTHRTHKHTGALLFGSFGKSSPRFRVPSNCLPTTRARLSRYVASTFLYLAPCTRASSSPHSLLDPWWSRHATRLPHRSPPLLPGPAEEEQRGSLERTGPRVESISPSLSSCPSAPPQPNHVVRPVPPVLGSASSTPGVQDQAGQDLPLLACERPQHPPWLPTGD